MTSLNLSDIISVMNAGLTFESILKRDNNWTLFKQLYQDQLPENIIHETEKMLRCCTKDCGFATFICPHCGITKVIPFTCKSKTCSRCGKKHTDIWAHTLSEKLLNCSHRHIILTVSHKLWRFFIHNPDRQKLMLNTAAKIINNVFSQKQKLTIGMLLVLHPFGDDLKPNFHVHALVTCGGLSKNQSHFVDITYIDYNVIRKTWQYEILYALRDHCSNVEPTLNPIIDWCFKYKTNGFVIFADSIIKDSQKKVLRYIARYTRHPPISNRRIINYDGTSVTFSYESYGQKQSKTIPKFQFIFSVLQHISSKHFKTIRRFGLYSRRSTAKYQSAKSLLDDQTVLPFIKFNWRFNISAFNHHDPLLCEDCGSELELWSITYFDNLGLPKTVPKDNIWFNQPLFSLTKTDNEQQNRQLYLSSMSN